MLTAASIGPETACLEGLLKLDRFLRPNQVSPRRNHLTMVDSVLGQGNEVGNTLKFPPMLISLKLYILRRKSFYTEQKSLTG